MLIYKEVIEAAIRYTYKRGTGGSDCDLQNAVQDAGLLNPVKDAYEHGDCPDCGEDIPDNVKEGEVCENCKHVFYAETIFRKTLDTMDSSMENFKKGKVGPPIDLNT